MDSCILLLLQLLYINMCIIVNLCWRQTYNESIINRKYYSKSHAINIYMDSKLFVDIEHSLHFQNQHNFLDVSI